MIYNLQEIDYAYRPAQKENNYIDIDITKEELESLIKEFNEDHIGFSFEEFKAFLVKRKVSFKVVWVTDVVFKEYDSS